MKENLSKKRNITIEDVESILKSKIFQEKYNLQKAMRTLNADKIAMKIEKKVEKVAA